ncbi:major facilitator superfamily domain-containing protein [Panaeolus papilionaceus]|nr:major facilitator superfamily domain-containing protein [Panaeolus papilionaceus]
MPAENLILPDGPVDEQATELLHEFVHPHHDAHEPATKTSDGVQKLPWYKRPSPWWLLCAIPFTSIATSATIAPRIEIYTILACSVHKPDIFKLNYPGLELGIQSPIPLAINSSTSLPELYHQAGVSYVSGLSQHDGLGPNQVDLPPEKRNLCASDPVVQAAVAKLIAVIATSMGILTCVTTGFWGSFSDRYGRTRVMGISILGLLFTDFNFIFVTLFSKHLPGGYWFLLTGPIIEGTLGGLATGVAAIHAYIADTTDEGSRSRTFSLFLGLMFIGMAVGPTLGSLLIRTTQTTLSVFYLAAAMHVLYTILIWLVLPESLSKEQRQRSMEKYHEELTDSADERERNPTVGLFIKTKRLFAFLSPISVFLPHEEKNENPLKKGKKDWSLTFLAISYGCTIAMMGSYSYKFQYAASTFKWSSETLGYWLSLVGAARAFFLTLILPVTIKLLKPKPVIIEIPAPPSSSDSIPNRTVKKEVHSPAFDLGLARASLMMEIIAYSFMAVATTGLGFTVFGMMGSFGAGFSPAVQSVALSLYTRKGGIESGRLFGGLSVIQALCAQIFGPFLYGVVYAKTVATYPRAIFFVSVASLIVSFVILALVRIPKDPIQPQSREGDLEETEPLLASGSGSTASRPPPYGAS